jgi:CelD/BcsL family acetyltransferase involved in cellulose biosynthesis
MIDFLVFSTKWRLRLTICTCLNAAQGWRIGRNVSEMTVSVVKGAAAQTLIRDSEFRQKWTHLLTRCPWSTAFQSYGFVYTWYQTYREQYEPAIVFEISAHGDLLGLLALAVRRDREEWVVAGDHQAEYQMWLATPHNGESFISLAMTRLCKDYNIDRLRFTYILGSAPLDWAQSGPWRRYCVVSQRSRPIMVLKDINETISSLRKKSNKSRFNRLQRLGAIQFERITERDQLCKIMSDLEVMYDFRLGAVYGTCPFREDKFKREFHLALMDISGLLHVTLLKAGNDIVAFHIGVCDEDTVYNGILAYRPFEARHSPGKLLVLLLAKDLAENNFARFDLTPGRDPWKARFANDREIVHRITVYSRAWKCRVGRLSQVAVELTGRVMRLLGAEPHDARKMLRILDHRQFSNLTIRLCRGISCNKRSLIFSVRADTAARISGERKLNRDCLEDLLTEAADALLEPRDGFLRDALKRIESGQHPYTAVIDGRLAFCGWLIETPKPEKGPTVRDHSRGPLTFAVIGDFTMARSVESVVFLEEAMVQMVHDAALVPCVEQILVSIPHNSRLWLEVVERINLKYADSFRRVSKEEISPKNHQLF